MESQVLQINGKNKILFQEVIQDNRVYSFKAKYHIEAKDKTSKTGRLTAGNCFKEKSFFPTLGTQHNNGKTHSRKLFYGKKR